MAKVKRKKPSLEQLSRKNELAKEKWKARTDEQKSIDNERAKKNARKRLNNLSDEDSAAAMQKKRDEQVVAMKQIALVTRLKALHLKTKEEYERKIRNIIRALT